MSASSLYYDASADKTSQAKLKMISDLHKDFKENRLQVCYQPQVDLISEKIIGLEALLRWQDGNGLEVAPSDFIPLAEYSGLIVKMGEWVFEDAVKSQLYLNKLGLKDIRTSINVSVSQFRDPNFVSFIANTIDEYGVDANLLELEITESVVMHDPEMIIAALNNLKALGLKIALDDFGTGYSSMSYLQMLPLDRLKVDKSFISQLDEAKSRVIIESIFSLGSSLGLKTIAEGIETRSQASQMLRLGADEAQGFLYSKALPMTELKQHLLS